MSLYIEPAIKSYFFGKGYRDLKNVITDSWQRNKDSASDFFSRIDSSGEWWEQFWTFIFWGGAGVSVMLFGTLFFLSISVLHITFLGLFFSLIYICFSVVWLVETIFLFLKQFFVACPHCHEKCSLPEYLCDKCGNIHGQLRPNQYGILQHQCNCGQKLPGTFFVNRGRLQARCPSCHLFLHREHIESRRIFVPILGGPSAGKTAFMFAVVRKLIEEKAQELGFSAEFIDTNTKSKYNKVLAGLKHGEVPGKTTEMIPKAFNIALKKDGVTKWLMYIYDPAGEAYQAKENLTSHHYQEYLSGMVLIVDPFSITEVKKKYSQQLLLEGSKVEPSRLAVSEALNRVILTMEESYGLSKKGKIKKPLAVVLSKIDAFDLENIIGETAVDIAYAEAPTRSKSDIRNELIRNQLANWNERALLQQLDARFDNVNFYSCSALGRIPDSSSKDLLPKHVFEPISWLCNSVNSTDFILDSSDGN